MKKTLLQLRDQALRNAKRQYNREKLYGLNHIRVRYTFWQQVAKDYTNQIKHIIMNTAEVDQRFLSLLPTSIIVEGAMAANQVRVNGVLLKYKNYNNVFGWGYGGSGPKQFAESLLLKYVTKEMAAKYKMDLKFGWVGGLPQTDFIKTINLRQIMTDILDKKQKA